MPTPLLSIKNLRISFKHEKEWVEASKSDKKNVEWDNQMNYLTQCVTKAAAYLDKRKKKDIQRKYIVILYNYILFHCRQIDLYFYLFFELSF